MIAFRSSIGDSTRRSGSKVRPVSFDSDGSVIQQMSQNRLVNVHRRDLVHVRLDRMPINEPPFVDHALIGYGDFGNPANEPGMNGAHDRQGAEYDRGENDDRLISPTFMRQEEQDDADDQVPNRAVVDDPVQPANRDDLLARLEAGAMANWALASFKNGQF